MWDKITYPIPNFNCAAVEVWEWMSNFVPHFPEHVITYPMLWLKLIHVSKRGPRTNDFTSYQNHYSVVFLKLPFIYLLKRVSKLGWIIRNRSFLTRLLNGWRRRHQPIKRIRIEYSMRKMFALSKFCFISSSLLPEIQHSCMNVLRMLIWDY